MRTERIGLVLFLLVIIIANLSRTGAFVQLRTVDAIQILAAGVLIGVLLPELFRRVRNREK